MATIKGITEKLYEQADEQVKKDVESLIDPLSTAVMNYNLNSMVCAYEDHYFRFEVDGKFYALDNWRLLRGLRDSLIEGMKDQYRERAIREFLKIVDELKDRVEELESSVNRG